MAKILKVFHLPDQDRVANMNIRSRGVEAGLHAQWLSGFLRPFELVDQLLLADDFHCASSDVLELFLYRNSREIPHLFIPDTPGRSRGQSGPVYLELRTGPTGPAQLPPNKSDVLL